MIRARALVVAGFALALGACASVLGIDDPIVDLGLDGSAGDASVGDAVGGDVVQMQDAGDARIDSSMQDGSTSDTGADVVEAGPCPPTAVDDTAGVFVDLAAVASANCGDRTTPCKTIQKGLDQAHATSGKTTVYVKNGTYTETVSLYGGLKVLGGWSVVGTTWTTTCNGGDVKVMAPNASNVTVRADALTGGAATLEKLTVLSKAKANVLAGETIYGLLITGAATIVHLVDVDVVVTDGGDGITGSTGSGGANATGDCVFNDGNTGAPPGSQGSGADAGTFGSTGYSAGVGATGGAGQAGHSGTKAAAPPCLNCVSCSGTITCSVGNGGTSCGTAGGSGCGGSGGNGGNGGGPGGSSIALYVYDAHVDLSRGTLTAANGGNGASGGTPGDGGLGSLGSTGNNGNSCPVACGLSGLNCVPTAQGHGDAGGGTQGGAGAVGGNGGGGAGGWSCAAVKAGAGIVTYGGATRVHGSRGLGGGSGAGAGAAGLTQDECP